MASHLFTFLLANRVCTLDASLLVSDDVRVELRLSNRLWPQFIRKLVESERTVRLIKGTAYSAEDAM